MTRTWAESWYNPKAIASGGTGVAILLWLGWSLLGPSSNKVRLPVTIDAIEATSTGARIRFVGDKYPRQCADPAGFGFFATYVSPSHDGDVPWDEGAVGHAEIRVLKTKCTLIGFELDREK